MPGQGESPPPPGLDPEVVPKDESPSCSSSVIVNPPALTPSSNVLDDVELGLGFPPGKTKFIGGAKLGWRVRLEFAGYGL